MVRNVGDLVSTKVIELVIVSMIVHTGAVRRHTKMCILISLSIIHVMQAITGGCTAKETLTHQGGMVPEHGGDT